MLIPTKTVVDLSVFREVLSETFQYLIFIGGGMCISANDIQCISNVRNILHTNIIDCSRSGSRVFRTAWVKNNKIYAL